jgi:RNA polymerase sigma factor for flagellar operon FliA
MMDESSQIVIVLHYYSKLDLRRIAEELDLTESRVSQLHSKGVLAVKEALMRAAQENI